MSVITVVNIRCDGCEIEAGHTTRAYRLPAVNRALAEVADLGWIRILAPGARDYCPTCRRERNL